MEKTILITGFTSGIGKATAYALLHEADHLLLVCRNKELGEQVIHSFRSLHPKAQLHLYVADLAVLQQVKVLTDKLIHQWPHLNLLINNAGTFVPNFQTTEDGLEKTLATNYFGPVLLTYGLLPLLKNASDASVINVVSEAAQKGALPKQQPHPYQAMAAYCNSKLYLLMFTITLSQQLASSGIKVHAIHPGGVNTNFGKNVTGLTGFIFRWLGFMMRTPEQGADTLIWMALNPPIQTGQYYIDRKPAPIPEPCKDAIQLNTIWQYTQTTLRNFL